MDAIPSSESSHRSFLEELRVQRWDDHRLYHHSRVNQSLHLVSALCFLSAYVLVWFDLVAAVLIGWLLAMATRQTGHFVFEPKSYDLVNQMSHQDKESIKVGYNLFRKSVLLSVWAAIPLLLGLWPTAFGLFEAPASFYAYLHSVCVLWLALGIAAVVFRTLQLFVLQGVQAGLVWLTKILTDPFHDVKIYWRSPLKLLQGERYDPMAPWPGVS